jgi:hypothetical protein
MFARTVTTIAIILLVNSSLDAGKLKENEMISGGGFTQADGFWVSGPSIWLRRDQPGVVLGMIQPPKGNREYAYLLIIKGDEKRNTLANFESQSKVDGILAQSSGSVLILGNQIKVDYQARMDPKGKQALQENLSLNGKSLDLRKGRVFLVDLSGKEARWNQVQGPLPANPDYPQEIKKIEETAKKSLNSLRKENAKVREFLK